MPRLLKWRHQRERASRCARVLRTCVTAMAGTFDDVVKKVTRFKVQLADTTESDTVLKVLQNLGDLDITVDILAETGIGKIVNSLRRHKRAGEFAKSLVRGWKKLLSKNCMSNTGYGAVSQTKDKEEESPSENAEEFTANDLNNNCVTYQSKSQDSSDEAVSSVRKRKSDSVKQGGEEQNSKKRRQEMFQQENHNILQDDVSEKKKQKDGIDDSVAFKKKYDPRDGKSVDFGNTLLKSKNSGAQQHSVRSDLREKVRIHSDVVVESGPEEGLQMKHKLSKRRKETFLFDRNDRNSKTLKTSNVRDKECPKNYKRKTVQTKSKDGQKVPKQKSDTEELSEHKSQKAKMKHKNKEHKVPQEEPFQSFESCLNYEVKTLKRKEHSGRKYSKKLEMLSNVEATKQQEVKPAKSPVFSVNACPVTQKPIMDLASVSFPVVPPACEKPYSFDCCDRKVEKEDLCDLSEESAVFTGQRLNRKMQVYSGAKTVFLPTMLSLYQQCVRKLQNNIDLLYETGGVPFEILEPVLERCTPEQLQRIEECNPIYVGVTDHMWGKHCQRDFRNSELLEYESWKEMYIRLSEERERKLQRLTKTIVSAHSRKPKGRQVKMAFIHTVAKPPRDVRVCEFSRKFTELLFDSLNNTNAGGSHHFNTVDL
uniref:Elongin A, like n=1 Tax=Cynoglossus semilaevis TaxID=244447 RepID=A0A3P8VR94_CYNSE